MRIQEAWNKMPLNKYYKGKGDKVMGALRKEYGPEKGKQVFYAMANKKKSNKPKQKSK